jgi:MFS family permease
MTDGAIPVTAPGRAEVPDRPEAAGLGRDFWRLWAADGVSNLADGILKVALPLVALTYTRSPALIAGLAFAFTLPWLLFALPAGALVDRVDRRRAMISANTVRTAALVALVATMLLSAGSIWALYAVAFCVGTAETVYDTAAQSIVPQLVPRDRLPRANGRLFAVELTANQFVGPPLAGVLVAVGATFALATPLGLWAVALGAILLLRGSFRAGGGAERPDHSTLRADIAEGLRFLRHHRLLRTLAAMTGAYNFATNATFAVLVLYATGPGSAMNLSKQGFGLLLATTAVGSVLGSFVAERVTNRLGRARALALSIPGGALLVGIPAVTTNPYLVGAGFVLGGVANIIWNVIAVSLRQQLTPDRLLGRVNSAYRLLAWGVMPVGAAAGGLLAQAVGLRAVFVVMAAVMLAMLLGMRVVTDRRMADAERDAATTLSEASLHSQG